jgi:hypothetical protein
MKIMMIYLIMIFCVYCGKAPDKNNSMEVIVESARQDSIFAGLLAVTSNSIPKSIQKDSLAFLILPLQASCPNCRKKTIDSILGNRDRLLPNHFIILSVKGGRKIINSYFKEEDAELPVLADQLFLDSLDLASSLNLYDKKPTMYYTYGRKALKKVASIPTTVKKDLHQFFSGNHYSKKES